MSNLVIIIVFGIVSLISYGLFVAQPAYDLQLCNEFTPEGYVVVSGYVFGYTLNCAYETMPLSEYDFCNKVAEKTYNHGKIVIIDTCSSKQGGEKK